MKAHYQVSNSPELPLGEPEEFSLTPEMVAKTKKARRAGMEMLKHATNQRPVSSLTLLATQLNSQIMTIRFEHDFEFALEVNKGDWR